MPRRFFLRPATVVAKVLLGTILVHRSAEGDRVGRIVETEAYLGLSDEAAHSWRGVTPRTRVLFGPPGHAYVYLIYGMYHCLNLVAEPEGSPGCVLLRAIDVIEGEGSGSGPGRLCRALGVTLAQNGADVTHEGSLTVHAPARAERFTMGVSPRIGITKNVDWPLRFYVAGNACVSGPKKFNRPL